MEVCSRPPVAPTIVEIRIILSVKVFVWTSEQRAITSLYNINWLVFITEAECLLRGTDWVLKSGRYIFDHKLLMSWSFTAFLCYCLLWHKLTCNWKKIYKFLELGIFVSSWTWQYVLWQRTTFWRHLLSDSWGHRSNEWIKGTVLTPIDHFGTECRSCRYM
jgi:hypothetical protein